MRLASSMLVAAALHAGALVLAGSPARPTGTSPVEVTPLVVRPVLPVAPSSPPGPAGAPAPSRVASRTVGRRTVTAAAPVVASVVPIGDTGDGIAVAAPAEESVPAGGPAGGGSAGGSGGGSGGAAAPPRDDVGARIRARIVSHRRYPELARRRGIEGTVRVVFSIAPDGRVADLAVTGGAHPSLDEAAREAVLAAAPLPHLPGPIEISLDFRLREAATE